MGLLFEKFKIKNLELKNRIVMPAINLAFAPDGQVNERVINFYEQRARGGAALLMIGGVAVDSSGIYAGFLSLHDDSFIENHRKLCQSVHDKGAKIGIQLFHSGRYSLGFLFGKEVLAPSAIASRFTKQLPRAMTVAEIKECVENFAQTALRAIKADYDLIEVICSAGYLINQFLSPLSNQRDDEYGGSFTNRMRFALEIIHSIRKEIGTEFPLSVRLGADDFMHGGNTWKEMLLFAQEMEKAGVDFFNVTGGWHESRTPQITSEVPRANYAYLANLVKSVVKVPVAASNRINSPEIAEAILNAQQADLISVGRGFLADPNWANKAYFQANIRKCIACMACLSNLFTGNEVLCAINPQCSFESTRVINACSQSKQVLIVGAGPAGLEAARVAALKGHQVVLWEKEEIIGGQWNIAAVPPGKAEFRSLLDFYQEELKRLKVVIELNQTANITNLTEAKADVIILATGAVSSFPILNIAEETKVYDSWQVLQGQALSGSKIVVVGGGAVGCETALHIAERGTLSAESLKFLMLHQAESYENLQKLITRGPYQVEIVEMQARLATDMGLGIRWTVLKHMKLMGINAHLNCQVQSIDSEGLRLVDEKGEEKFLAADCVVLATGSVPHDELYHRLEGKLEAKLYLIGDACKPAQVMEAIHQAFDIANSID